LNRPSTYYLQAPKGDTETKPTTDIDSQNSSKEVNESERKIATQDSKRDTKTNIDSPRTNGTERTIESLGYKKVANKTRPIATTLPEEFRIVRRIPSDPLANLPILTTHPPDFEPGERYTKERKEAMPVNKDGFLWPEEEKLVHYLIKVHESAFAWNENEKGKFSDEYFDPVVIPTVEHVPWVLRNIPIPPGIYDRVVEVIKHKIRMGVFEPSNSSYRSRWFCVLKKDGKSLRLVHDLQPLNAVTIRDSALIPMVEQYAESFGGRACYAMFDLFVGFDQRALATKSRDLTTFQTPLGTFRMTSIPMGYTNSVQIQQGDITFILQEEIPHITVPFIDDIPVKGPPSRYQDSQGIYETIPDNPRIRKFIWDHLQNVNRIIQRIQHAGGTFSGHKSFLCVESTIIVGHRCTMEGRIPDESRVQKIVDWPICRSLTEVRGFLGTMGTIRVFIKNFAMHARPLVQLTKKNVEFEFGGEHLLAMEKMKHFAQECPAIRAIDYHSDNEVILSVDSSWMAVGFILSQVGEDGKRYPSRFGSIMWNEREQKYSQAKIELYGLFRALKAVKLFIIGVKNLTVEVDAKYIKGMINNPDIQPSATINRWIVGILLFHFKLKHVPGKDHVSADGLSRRPQAPEDLIDEDDHEDWIDKSYAFGVELLNWIKPSRKPVKSRLHNSQTYGHHQDHNLKRSADWTSVFVGSLTQDQVDIPRTDRAQARDEEIIRIRKFLEDPDKINCPNDKEFKRFIQSATKFFVNKDQLWRKDRHGKHKLVIPNNRRLDLI